MWSDSPEEVVDVFSFDAGQQVLDPETSWVSFVVVLEAVRKAGVEAGPVLRHVAGVDQNLRTVSALASRLLCSI